MIVNFIRGLTVSSLRRRVDRHYDEIERQAQRLLDREADIIENINQAKADRMATVSRMISEIHQLESMFSNTSNQTDVCPTEQPAAAAVNNDNEDDLA